MYPGLSQMRKSIFLPKLIEAVGRTHAHIPHCMRADGHRTRALRLGRRDFKSKFLKLRAVKETLFKDTFQTKNLNLDRKADRLISLNLFPCFL